MSYLTLLCVHFIATVLVREKGHLRITQFPHVVSLLHRHVLGPVIYNIDVNSGTRVNNLDSRFYHNYWK